MRTQNNYPSKKSFILYIDTLSILDELTDEQSGQLFKKIKEYHSENKPNKSEKTHSVNSVIDLLFIQFKLQFDRDLDKYNTRVEVNRNNGKLGGRPKIKKRIKAKKADNDNVSVNVNVNESESENEIHPLHFFDYEVSYEKLPDSIKTNIPIEDYNTWQLFNKHLDTKCKRIRQIPEQLNISDYLEYKARYIKSNLIQTDLLKNMLSKLNNHKSIGSYLSVYDSLIDWTEREIKYKTP